MIVKEKTQYPPISPYINHYNTTYSALYNNPVASRFNIEGMRNWVEANLSTSHYATLQQTMMPQRIEYENGRHKMNFCDHHGEKLVLREHFASPRLQWHSVFMHLNKYEKNYWTVQKGFPIISTYRPSQAGIVGEVPQTVRNEAWLGIQPRFKAPVSIANFLLELRDVKELLTLFGGIKGKLKRLRREGDLTDPGAEYVLAYSFGLAPLVDDIRAIIEHAFNIGERLETYKRQGEELAAYHWRRTLVDEIWSITTYRDCDVIRGWKEVFMATLWATYQYEAIMSWGLASQYLGLHMGWAEIWNGIPFSFLLDYVLKIGDAIETATLDPNQTLKMHAYVETVKADCYTSFRLQRHTNVGYGAPYVLGPYFDTEGRATEIARWSRYHYLRRPSTPSVGVILPHFDAISNRELVLFGALLRANLR